MPIAKGQVTTYKSAATLRGSGKRADGDTSPHQGRRLLHVGDHSMTSGRAGIHTEREVPLALK